MKLQPSVESSSRLPLKAGKPIAESVMVEPLRQRRKEARPGELIAAALELFVQRGFSATRLDDVARQAGVSKGTLYLYFDSKESLFKAAIKEGLVPALASVGELIDSFTGPTPQLMESLVLYWWRSVGDTPLGGIPKLMLSEARNFPELAQFYQHEVIELSNSMIRRTLERGIERDEIRPIDLEATIALLFSPLLMLVIWRHSFGACGMALDHPFREPERFLRAHVDMAMHGLLTNPKKKA